MALRKMIARIRIRGGTYVQWSNANPVLEEREISFVISGQNAGKFKVGDGVTTWQALPYTAARFPEDILQLADQVASSTLPNNGDIKQLFQQIRNYLKWETQERIAADTALQQADVQLQQNINEEAQERSDADHGVSQAAANSLNAHNTSGTAHPDIRALIDDIAIAGGGGGGSGMAESFTFVVDSNAALSAWATDAPGNDYSRVLVRAGTWTYNDPRTSGGSVTAPLAAIDISNKRTLSVIGESGSKIVIMAAVDYSSGLHLAAIKGALANASEYHGSPIFSGNPVNGCFIRNLNVETKIFAGISSGIKGGNAYGFVNIANQIGCTSTVTGRSSGAGSASSSAYHFCANLINCTATGNGGSSGQVTGIGFGLCANLINCTATGNGSGGGNGWSFYRCRTGFGCRPIAASTAYFSQCYMEQGNSSTTLTLWDNTAAGGYNGTEVVNGSGNPLIPSLATPPIGSVLIAYTSFVSTAIYNATVYFDYLESVPLAVYSGNYGGTTLQYVCEAHQQLTGHVKIHDLPGTWQRQSKPFSTPLCGMPSMISSLYRRIL